VTNNRAGTSVSGREHFRGPDTIARRAAGLALTGPAALAAPAARWAVNIMALAGAALLAWSGVIHLQLWADGYRSISVIGPLFLVQGVGSIVIAAALAAFRRLALIAAGALTLAATAAGLLLSVYAGLFGYKESLAVPYAQSSLVIEFTGAALLAALAVFVVALPARSGAARGSNARAAGAFPA
jgi:hypothetical protein